ncbi:MAG TPA: hypothetical protein DCG28_04295 [Lachnospiraceae bacterium]|nr:hypothetical protein [Lachnospiraceae bacterium]
MPQKEEYTQRVTLCPDGKYRWIYEFDMIRNPVIFITVSKVLLLSFLVVFAFVILIGIKDLTPKYFFDTLLCFVLLALIFQVIGFIAYLIVAKRYGYKYIVLFEMDENGFVHRQMESQFEKASAMGWLTAAMGAVSGNISAIAAGINSATHDSLATDFKLVKSIKPIRKFNTVKVNSPFSKNQIYVEKEDFDFVLEYIKKRVEEKKNTNDK